ncbi:tRNA lysidine(34) synthetase TilS [Paraburkholderia sp. DHOC27]|uniref:tRNA lysidine(34) synthetase TilS n=1 Tax=Paraburkholderia sp. DHOC27 TaxID=2303330 RepID=UPI000E3B8AFD|nr:tRNA lysidine(34) synthetase TilS [Paraburkholderia sp. DHOC27]RFU45547.1 tRNA lysidine(34) synthetase TilS [Paraburkholderia sp. DHOC27]
MTQLSDIHADRLVLEAVGAVFSASTTGLDAGSQTRVAVAFSGGVDSAVLLDAAVRVAGPARCLALHVHHGLSPHADQWLAHCENFARERGIAFAAQRVEVPRDAGVSIEAAARDARYRALDALCAQHGVATLWLAQHADDQAETVLLQLLRGAGLPGLAAMAPEHLPSGASVTRVRPFLHLLRAQLVQVAQARGLSWIEDESNADTRYARNALRHDVLPALGVTFPGFRDALARTAAHAASAQRLLDALARIDLDAAAREDGAALAHDVLLAFDDERALNLLRYWMRLRGLPAASTARLSDALRQLREVGAAHNLRVDHAGHALRSYDGQIYWEAGDSTEAADETALAPRPVSQMKWQGESIWRLPQWRGTFVFVDATADDPFALPASVLAAAPLIARSRSGGERMRVSAQGPGRTLKNLFQEQRVPAWKRDVPLLFVGDTLLFVPLLGVNRGAWEPASSTSGTTATAAERYLRIEWREDLTIA